MKRAIIVAGAALGCSVGFSADIYLGDGDSLAMDQPRVVFQFTEPGTDNPVGDALIGLLDTGANGILLSQQAYDQMGSPHQPYTPALNSDNQPVVYYESGVAGYEVLTVYQVYDLQLAGWPGSPPQTVQLVENVRPFGTPYVDLGVAGIIGMPVMAGRVVQIDPKPITRLMQFDLTNVEFYTAPPVSKTPVSYTVNLPMMPYEHAGVDPLHPDDPLPTFADLPLIDLSTTAKGITVQQRLLMDTGAQTSIISLQTALAMGIDMRDESLGGDVVDHLQVGGLGGMADLPMVKIDWLRVPTNEGDDLLVSNVYVGVLDIIGIDGVLGMDFLMNGYAQHIFADTGEYGAFSEITFDFRNPEMGILRLDMNPAYVVPEPSSLALFGAAAMLLWRRRRAEEI